MKKSCLVAAVLLSIGSGCLLPNEVGATDYYWDKEEQTWVDDVSKATATDNEAVLPKDEFYGSEWDALYAGYSAGDVEDNSFTVEKTITKIGIVNGGFSFDGNAEGNTVTITGSSEVDTVYGGSSIYGNAIYNAVTISDKSNVGEVDGGYSQYENAEGNLVIISGSSEVDTVYGGYGFKNAKDNKVTINGGRVTEVYGGEGDGGYATGNTVIINSGSVTEVYGGYSYGGNPTGNNVIINGGKVDLAIGAYSEYKEVQGNEVIISNSTGEGHVGDVYASATGRDNTLLNSNIVTWKDGDVQGNIFGGALYAFDFSTGDSGFTPVENASGILNVYHSSGSNAKTIAEGKSIVGFDRMNFYLSGDIKARDTIIDNSQGNAVDMNNVKTVTLQNDPDKTKKLINNFKKDDVITLISNTTGEKAYEDATLTAGGLDYVFNVNANGEALIATAADDGVEPKPEPEPEPEPEPGPDPKPEPEPEPKPEPKPEPIKPTKVNEETKALLEGHAAAALAVNQMVDNTINVALKDAELAASANDKDSAGKFNAFISANYNKDRISTGSYVDVKGLSGTIGIARKLNNKSGALTYGLFLEGGKNKFDTSNDFASGTVHGKGDANSFGGGLFAKQKNNSGMYVEGSLRVGRVNHDFEGFVAKQNAEYDAKSTYYGAHVGLGKLIASGKGEWDVYGKLIYTHINGATADVYDGSKLELDAMNSTRLRVGGRYNVNPAPKAVGYYAGLAYEYEFGGQADGKLQGFGLEAPTSKGSTGILELGAKFQPTQNFGIDLGVEGHAGKRRGVGGNVNFKWSF